MNFELISDDDEPGRVVDFLLLLHGLRERNVEDIRWHLQDHPLHR